MQALVSAVILAGLAGLASETVRHWKSDWSKAKAFLVATILYIPALVLLISYFG